MNLKSFLKEATFYAHNQHDGLLPAVKSVYVRIRSFTGWLTLLAVFALALPSCLDDGDPYPAWAEFWVSYGVIRGESAHYDILTDEGKILYPEYPLSSSTGISDGKRVAVSYSITGARMDGYSVRLRAIEPILTKLPVHSTGLTVAEEDSIGHDPVHIIDAWFGGNVYLNVDFDILRSDPSIVHYVNLWVDDDASTPERKVVVFRHNDNSDLRHSWASGSVSFKVDALIPEDADSVKVVFRWETYSGRAMADSGYIGRRPALPPSLRALPGESSYAPLLAE